MKLNLRTFLTLASFLILYTGLNAYIGWHLTVWFNTVGIPLESSYFWVIFYVVAYGYMGGRLPFPEQLAPIGRLWKVIGSYYLFLFEMGLLLLVLGDAIALVIYLTGGQLDFYIEYAGMVLICLTAILLLIGSRNAWSSIVRKHELVIHKPIPDTEQLTENGVKSKWVIAVASDIHLGNMVGNRQLKRLVKLVNNMNPDLILLPGDIIDDSIEPFLRNNMSRMLGQLKAKDGIYAVLGNHEYYGGHIEQYVEEMNRIGIKVLQDEIVEIRGALYVVGRRDKTAESLGRVGRMEVHQLLSTLDLSIPVILLDHQPTQFQKAADAGADLLLCGHTHRGQFFPNDLFTRKLYELDWGYMKKDAMHVIVSSGFGLWGPPIRLGSRSEIIQLEVQVSG